MEKEIFDIVIPVGPNDISQLERNFEIHSTKYKRI